MSEKHPVELPSKYVVVRVDYGSGNKHLYTMDDWGGVEFFPERQPAEDAAQKMIEEDPRVKVAIMKIESILAADIKVKSVVKTA